MPEKILLGDIELEAVQIVNLTKKATIPQHKVEKLFSIADHIILEPAEFSLDVICTRDSYEHERLKQLYESKQLVMFHSDLLGTYDNMVIEGLDFQQGGSVNVLRASIRIKQILIAESKTITIELPITPTIQETPANTTARDPEEKSTNNEPQKEEGKSWLDSIAEWLGGLFGG